VLVVGAGLAGLVTALTAVGRRVTLLCPSLPREATASALAQGGIAAAVGDGDSPELHAADTWQAGAGAGCARAVETLCTEALPAIRWLEDQGVRFDRDGDGWALHREAAHRCARVLHVDGDITGAALVDVLFRVARRVPTIDFRPGYTAIRLSHHAGRITGVFALDASSRLLRIAARDTVLATGGIGQLYGYTTNPRSAAGDGLAMALAAGARGAALEFVQFHPTALAAGTDPLPLITEALRGAGARLLDVDGIRFMPAAHPAAELAPRDVVARAVWRQIRAGGEVRLDATQVLAEQPAAFPTVRRLCLSHGIDPARQPIPVVPAAHYHMGGVAVDIDGRTSLPHLWACGEVACTGVHGANRLASNSLLEAVVFGRRLGAALGAAPCQPSEHADAREHDLDGATIELDADIWHALRRLMWARLGIERDARGLEEGLATLRSLERRVPADQVLLSGRLQLARVLLNAALARSQSLGAHFRVDDPGCADVESTSAMVSCGSSLRVMEDGIADASS